MNVWNWFLSNVWGKKIPKILFSCFAAFLAYYGLRSCFFSEPGPKERLYRIARDPAAAGSILRGRESNVLGFSDKLLDNIARKENFHIEFYASPTVNLIPGLQDDNYDAIVSVMTPDIFSKERFIFSDPIYYVGPVLIVDSNSNVNTIEELAGKVIGIQRGSQLLIQGRIPKTIIVYPYDSMTIAIDDLLKDRIDGVVTDLFYAYGLQEGFYRSKIKVIPQGLTNDALRLIAMKHDNMEQLIEAFNAGLQEMKETGFYNDLVNNFRLPSIEIHD